MSYPFTVAQLQALSEERCDLTVATEAGTVVGFANLYNLEPGHSIFIGNARLGFRPSAVEERCDGEGQRVALLHMVVHKDEWHQSWAIVMPR